jgi:hypothetical protein
MCSIVRAHTAAKVYQFYFNKHLLGGQRNIHDEPYSRYDHDKTHFEEQITFFCNFQIWNSILSRKSVPNSALHTNSSPSRYKRLGFYRYDQFPPMPKQQRVTLSLRHSPDGPELAPLSGCGACFLGKYSPPYAPPLPPGFSFTLFTLRDRPRPHRTLPFR